ncbi:MAG: choice-of-anchor Q domain-containing protein, partial [Actinomycetota bacterium]
MTRRISLAMLVPLLLAGWMGSAQSSAVAVITPTRFDDPTPDGCSNNGCSLREAIIQANATSGPDEIILSAGTYLLTLTGAAEDLAASGDLDITREALTITGAGKTATVVDAGEEDGLAERVFHIGQFEAGDQPDVAISGLTITGGWANDGAEINGGGIFLFDGSLTVTDAGLIDNYGGQNGSGGGLQAESGTTATLMRVEVAENSTTTSGSAAGIAVVLGTVTILDSSIHDNHAMFVGGGIAAYSGALSVRDTTISGNSSPDDGGGLYSSGTTTSLDNVTITGNLADTDQNDDGQGGGIARFGGTVTIRNTIIAGNDDQSPPGSQPDDCFGTVVSEGHNLIGNGEGCTVTPTTGDQIGTAAAPIDPKLGSIADNGGPTPTHALLPGSTAIDGGESVTPRSGGAGCDSADQRGAPRTGTCDIGAYELVLCKGIAVTRVGTGGN